VNNTATTIWARSGILEKGHNSVKFKPHTHKKERKKGTNKNIYIQSVHVNCVLCDNMYHQALPLHTDSTFLKNTTPCPYCCGSIIHNKEHYLNRKKNAFAKLKKLKHF
jgi:tRNA(Arg) A34 adenosine deaminase TadA